jgi:VCBS repeat-containing protein
VIQRLAPNQTLTETFSYTIKDNNGDTSSATLTITINGADDITIAKQDVRSVSEDSTGAITGNVKSNDNYGDGSDAENTIKWGGETASFGILVRNNDGTFSYKVTPSAVKYLQAGDSRVESFSYTLTDSNQSKSESSLSVTILGADDTPVPLADDNGLAEDSASAITGNVRTNDAIGDGTDSENVLVWGAEAAKYGSIKRYEDGSYSYTLDNTNAVVQKLSPNDKLTETFSYTLTDKDGDTSTASLVITITGTNDVATVSSAVAALTETFSTAIPPVALPLVATGTLTVVDVDTNQNKVQAQTDTAGEYGTFSVNAAGEWTYTVNPALNLGDLSTDTFTVKSLDGTGEGSVTVTIKGTNDPAVITPVISSSATSIFNIATNSIINIVIPISIVSSHRP